MSGPHEFLARASAWLWPALVDHLWQSALFAALVFAATLLVRRGPARARHALWLVALVKFAVPPALFAFLAARAGLDASWLFGTRAAATATEYAPLVLQLTEPVATLSNSVGATAVGEAAHGEIYCALTAAWLAGCASLLLMRLRRRREFVRALGAGREVYAGREFDAMERARRRLGFETDARLLLSSHGAEPGVWRTRAPVVVLPETLPAHLDEEELESLMLHELSHVERRDNLIASLQTTLTCLFWFCPPVWLVSRRLLEERERACDERVLEAGGASGAYASSILKVVRFCSGWKVAGVSGAAAGPNLRRRIEDIMEARTISERTAWQRTLPLAAAIAALALSAGAGVYSHGQGGGGVRVAAARQQPQAQAGGGAKGDARVRVVPLNEAEGVAAEQIEQTPEASVRFDNAGDVPVVITEAKMRMVTREQLKRGDEGGEEKHGFFLTMPSVTVANFSAKTVKEIGLGFVIDGSANVIMGRRASIKPGESQAFLSEWNRVNVILPGTLADVVVQVVWVEFTDGTQWGGRARPPLAPGPPPPGGIGAARGTMPPPPSADAPTGHAPTGLPPTGEPPADAPPPPSQGHGPAAPIVVRGGSGEGVGADAGAGAGTAQGGGSGAGANVNGGILNQRVRTQPQPAYPPIARAARAQGTVAVRIVIDEEGRVISAEAVNGHPLLRSAAVEAARSATFAPTRLNGQPVKVTGHLTYNFVLDEKKQQQ